MVVYPWSPRTKLAQTGMWEITPEKDPALASPLGRKTPVPLSCLNASRGAGHKEA